VPSTPDICPACGSSVPPNAACCPHCGSDPQTGWSDRATAQHLGISDPDDFDYNEFVKAEFADPKPQVRPHGISWFWWIIAIILTLAFLSLIF